MSASHPYATAATILWLAAALFLALAASRFFELPFRQGIFLVVASMGGVLLLRVSHRSTPTPHTVTTPLLSASTKSVPSLTATMPRSEKLSPQEAREWLDDFLVRQQKKQ